VFLYSERRKIFRLCDIFLKVVYYSVWLFISYSMLTKVCRGFHQSFQANVEVVTWIRPQRLSYTSFQIHYSFIITAFIMGVTLMMEAESLSETSVSICQIIRRKVQTSGHFQRFILIFDVLLFVARYMCGLALRECCTPNCSCVLSFYNACSDTSLRFSLCSVHKQPKSEIWWTEV
jgi:hypothetical protein